MAKLSLEEIIKEKNKIRQKIKAKRKALSEEEKLSRSAEIWERFKREVLDDSRKNIMLYFSFDSEVYTPDIIRELARRYNIFLPRMQNKEIVVCGYKLGDCMGENGHGIFEPSPESVIENPCLDIIVVPGLAFDREGNRLGWGLGYYDRFLAKMSKLRPKPVIVAPAYSFQVVDLSNETWGALLSKPVLPHEKHDAKLDIIVTEKKAIYVPARYTCIRG